MNTIDTYIFISITSIWVTIWVLKFMEHLNYVKHMKEPEESDVVKFKKVLEELK